MNFRSINEIFKRITSSHVKTPLGRWRNHNYSETSLKIKYAAEDNCGVSYNNYKNTSQMLQNNDLDNDNDDNYIYMMGYESVHEKMHARS
jgi:hypothetical protein